MEPTPSELAARFASMEEPELQVLAGQRRELTDDARATLLAELHRRGIDPAPATSVDNESIPDPQVWVTVRSFRDLSEGIVARAALESAGISCLLRDENTVRLEWQISNFIGGMRLQVCEPDLQEAQQVLAGLAADEVAAEERCPRCNGTNLSHDQQRRGLALMALWLFGVPMPQGKAKWRCADCGTSFPEKQSLDY